MTPNESRGLQSLNAMAGMMVWYGRLRPSIPLG